MERRRKIHIISMLLFIFPLAFASFVALRGEAGGEEADWPVELTAAEGKILVR